MGGGGGNFWHAPRGLGFVKQNIKDREQENEYKAEVSDMLKDLLSDYNHRDAEVIRKHIDIIKKALSKEIDEMVETSFGGSVAKHTYVDGLSDVDILANIADTELKYKSPNNLLTYFADLIRSRLPNTKVETGKFAITITYQDGVDIQILPTVKTKKGIRIADVKGDVWSNIIHADKFANKLSEVNTQRGRLVVPVIKLFKGAQSDFPKDVQLSGYHIESLAINAFRNYNGSLNAKSMFQHLCSFTSESVKTPIIDSTGQSMHIDDNLGTANSVHRQRVSAFLRRLTTRLSTADFQRNINVWKEVLIGS